ncbi:MAG: response regulator [SAR324 cluster bacterium]|nr:response regulator [SAR324 cluster bacterium]
MISIKLVSQDKQTHKWIKEFSERKFESDHSFNPEETLESLSKKTVNLVLFDTDQNPMPLAQFMQELLKRYLYIPVLVISSNPEDLAELEMISRGIVGNLPKPFSQLDFHDAVTSAVEQHRKNRRISMAKGKTMDHMKESVFLVGFRRNAIVYKISKHGMVLFLPMALPVGTKIFFKGQVLYSKLGLTADNAKRIDLRVGNCTPAKEGSYKITTLFANNSIAPIKKELDQFIERHTKGGDSAFLNKARILIGCDDEKSRKLYQSALQYTPYELIFAKNGNDVLNKLGQSPVDLLFLDTADIQKNIGLAMDKIQKNYSSVMIATKQKNPKIPEQYLPLIQDIVLKPVDPQKLVLRIEKVLKSFGSKVRDHEGTSKDVGLYLSTRIMLAYRDSITIEKMRKDGLLFYKNLPLVHATSIYFSAGTLFEKMGLDKKNIGPLKMRINRCEYIPENDQYLVFGEFQDFLSFQLVIDAFVDGKPLPDITEQAAEEDSTDDLFNDLFVEFDEDYTPESSSVAAPGEKK